MWLLDEDLEELGHFDKRVADEVHLGLTLRDFELSAHTHEELSRGNEVERGDERKQQGAGKADERDPDLFGHGERLLGGGCWVLGVGFWGNKIAAMPTLIDLCGLPAAGKTTLAKRIEAERPALRLTPDDWFEALGVDLWDEEFRAKVEALQWEVAAQALKLGVDVVIDWGHWSREERDDLRARTEAIGAKFELIYLPATREELWSRLVIRNAELPKGMKPFTEADLDQWLTKFEPPSAEELRSI